LPWRAGAGFLTRLWAGHAASNAVLLLGGSHRQQRFSASILAAMGYATRIAASSDEALAAIQRGGLRCIIVDGAADGLCPAFWTALERAVVRAAPAPFVYFIAHAALADAGPSQSQAPRHRRANRPPRVIDLVRALDGASWEG
jgi:hypothetical protein